MILKFTVLFRLAARLEMDFDLSSVKADETEEKRFSAADVEACARVLSQITAEEGAQLYFFIFFA